jgi:DNA replication protein DnaC
VSKTIELTPQLLDPTFDPGLQGRDLVESGKMDSIAYKAAWRLNQSFKLLDPEHSGHRAIPALAKEWADVWISGKPDGNLLLYGDVGTRKSTTAALVGLYLYSQLSTYGGWMFVSASGFMRSLKASLNSPDEDPIGYAEAARVLVWDDFFRRREMTAFEAESFCQVFDSRLRARRPTIVTMSIIPELLFDSEYGIDDDLASRVANGSTVIAMEGHDWRKGAPSE